MSINTLENSAIDAGTNTVLLQVMFLVFSNLLLPFSTRSGCDIQM